MVWNTEIEERNAIIKKARIQNRERGILEIYLDLDYGGSGQAFGGHVLHLPEDWKHHTKIGIVGHYIYRILQIAGVGSWGDLPGKTIRVKQKHVGVEAIGHIVNDDWFYPAEDFEKYSPKDGQHKEKE